MAHKEVIGNRVSYSSRLTSEIGPERRCYTGLRVMVVTSLAALLATHGASWCQNPLASRFPNGTALAQQPPAPAGGAPGAPGAPPGGDGLTAPENPFDQLGPRMRGLPASTKVFGKTPIPSRETIDKYRKLVGDFVDPEMSFELIQNRPRLLHLKEPPFRIQVADDKILEYTVLGPPTELSFLGKAVGNTTITLWFGDRTDPAQQTVLTYLVNVLPDPEVKERLERTYKALEDEINKAFPDAFVCLFLVGDKLVVSGQVKDAMDAQHILQIVRRNAQGTGGRNPALQNPALQGNPVSLNLFNPSIIGNIPGVTPGGGLTPPDLSNYIVQGEPNIINLLRVAGEQQVSLRVIVAEVSRSAARSIGLNFSITNKNGIRVFAQNTGNLGAVSGAGSGLGQSSSASSGGINLPALIDNGQVSLAIDALRNIDMARSLAEPNLVTLNGRPAFFLAGGEFPVPVITGATATGLQGVSFVPFGVSINFTPFITDKDRIRMQISAIVSVRDVSTGTSFGTGNAGNTFVPGLNTRLINTTVEMREGQTLAIGGLLQTNLGSDSSRVPGWGDLPILGHLARVDHTSSSESELVLLVTPELVHAMEPNEVPPLPGSDYFEPGDLEFYLLGRLQSQRAYDYRSTVMDTVQRMAAYRHCEMLYFVGPHGHSDNH